MNRRPGVVTTIPLTVLLLTLCSTIALATNPPSAQSTTQPMSGNHALRVVTGGLQEESSQAAASATHAFQLPVKYSTGGYSPDFVAIADVNEDGRPDIIATNQEMYGRESSVSILLGNGDGTFQTGTVYDSGGVSAYSLAVADINHDGHLDLLIANGCASGANCSADGVLAVLLGNGDGTFQSAKGYDTGGSDLYHAVVAVADLNGDGNLDAVIAHGCGGITCSDGTVSALLGDGTGAFGAATTYASGGAGASSVAIADINGDHKPDLLTANWCASVCGTSTPTEGSVGVLLGNGDGTFQSAVPYPSGGNGTRSIATADMNGDGKIDALAASCGPAACAPGFPGGNAAVLLGDGDGTLQAALPNNAGDSPDAIQASDLNGDRKLDLVVGNWGTVDGGFQQRFHHHTQG